MATNFAAQNNHISALNNNHQYMYNHQNTRLIQPATRCYHYNPSTPEQTQTLTRTNEETIYAQDIPSLYSFASSASNRSNPSNNSNSSIVYAQDAIHAQNYQFSQPQPKQQQTQVVNVNVNNTHYPMQNVAPAAAPVTINNNNNQYNTYNYVAPQSQQYHHATVAQSVPSQKLSQMQMQQSSLLAQQQKQAEISMQQFATSQQNVSNQHMPQIPMQQSLPVHPSTHQQQQNAIPMQHPAAKQQQAAISRQQSATSQHVPSQIMAQQTSMPMQKSLPVHRRTHQQPQRPISMQRSSFLVHPDAKQQQAISTSQHAPNQPMAMSQIPMQQSSLPVHRDTHQPQPKSAAIATKKYIPRIPVDKAPNTRIPKVAPMKQKPTESMEVTKDVGFYYIQQSILWNDLYKQYEKCLHLSNVLKSNNLGNNENISEVMVSTIKLKQMVNKEKFQEIVEQSYTQFITEQMRFINNEDFNVTNNANEHQIDGIFFSVSPKSNIIRKNPE